LAIFRNRFASIQDIVLVFAACIAPICSWSILQFLEELRAWLFYLSSWDVISIFAYTQALALLESATVLLIVILLGAILPARFLRDRFVAQGSMVVLLTLGWAIATQYKIIPRGFRPPARKFFLLYLASIGVSWVLIHRYKRLEESIDSFVERLTVLLYVYIPTTFLSVIIVMFRNI
jgi:hypothetical protein